MVDILSLSIKYETTIKIGGCLFLFSEQTSKFSGASNNYFPRWALDFYKQDSWGSCCWVPSDSTRVEVTKLEFLNFNSRHLMVKKELIASFAFFHLTKKQKKCLCLLRAQLFLLSSEFWRTCKWFGCVPIPCWISHLSRRVSITYRVFKLLCREC